MLSKVWLCHQLAIQLCQSPVISLGLASQFIQHLRVRVGWVSQVRAVGSSCRLHHISIHPVIVIVLGSSTSRVSHRQRVYRHRLVRVAVTLDHHRPRFRFPTVLLLTYHFGAFNSSVSYIIFGPSSRILVVSLIDQGSASLHTSTTEFKDLLQRSSTNDDLGRRRTST